MVQCTLKVGDVERSEKDTKEELFETEEFLLYGGKMGTSGEPLVREVDYRTGRSVDKVESSGSLIEEEIVEESSRQTEPDRLLSNPLDLV